jgi:undecaprenol kinase
MKNDSLIKSFTCAIKGIWEVVKEDRNFKIDLFIGALAILLGIFLKISLNSWSIVIFVIFIILSAEIINSVNESICDLLKEKFNLKYEETTFIRDASAGVVLILAVVSVFVGILVFGPYIFKAI